MTCYELPVHTLPKAARHDKAVTKWQEASAALIFWDMGYGTKSTDLCMHRPVGKIF